MSVHFQNFLATRESPGVLLIPSSRSIGAAIEGLLFIWLNWTPGDLRNRVSWLPYMKIPERFLDRSREVCLVMAAGSVSFHHSLVMHASGPNRSEHSRRGLAVHYISSKSRWTGEPGKKPAYKLLRGQQYAGCV
jgi:Phytanoyl-CoA dioxygenase (PhyH)